jgi:hypothetical protein
MSDATGLDGALGAAYNTAMTASNDLVAGALKIPAVVANVGRGIGTVAELAAGIRAQRRTKGSMRKRSEEARTGLAAGRAASSPAARRGRGAGAGTIGIGGAANTPTLGSSPWSNLGSGLSRAGDKSLDSQAKQRGLQR